MIQNKPQFVDRFERSWPAILIGSVWLWMFWPMMSGQTVCGFRDSAYLYYPLFEWIDAQWAAGEIPLWNPYCNYGMPVVGDGTSSVFYPGKLIFFCRFLEYPARYGIYLAIHIPIAAAGTYWFARTLRANPTGATLAALAFAFGGSVIFQVCNVIYLVSAAWLPFALGCVWKMVKTGNYRWAIAAGTCCALMILGGDPQMVYHVGLIAVATTLGEAWRRRSRWNRTRNKITRPYGFAFSASKRLVVMILITSSLSAIQLLPTYSWSKRSERTNPTAPVNIYHAAGADSTKLRQSLLGPPDGSIDHAYQFSQTPWSMLELIFPNFSGKPFPKHQRWTNALPGADRVWNPSIYMGLLVVFFGLTGIRLSGRRRKNVWLSWLFLFFSVASFGWYGAVWFLTELGWTPPAWLGPQTGGIYWLMQILLPKYYAFRYPAKLFLLASLALALLAGISLRRIRFKPMLVITAVFAVLFCGTLFTLINNLIPEISIIGDGWLMYDPMFGPFDTAGAIWQAKISVAHALVVVGSSIAFFHAGAVLTRRSKEPKQAASSRNIRLVHGLLVITTALDIVVANHWLIAEVPSETFTTKVSSPIIEELSKLKSSIDDQSPVRVFRSRRRKVTPPTWYIQESDDRLEEIVTWQRKSLYHKHHLNREVVLLGSFASVWPSYYEYYLSQLEVSPSEAWPHIHGMFSQMDRSNQTLESNRFLENFDSVKPVVWLALRLPLESNVDPASAKTTVHVSQFACNRVTAIVSTNTPRELAFGRIAEPGWKATIRKLESNPNSKSAYASKAVQCDLEVDQRMETLVLPMEVGQYEVEFWYSPFSFWIGAWISGISWVILLAWSGGLCVKRRFLRSAQPGTDQNAQALPILD